MIVGSGRQAPDAEELSELQVVAGGGEGTVGVGEVEMGASGVLVAVSTGTISVSEPKSAT